MNRNELTVKVQKKINCYLFNAYYLCILLAYDNMYNTFGINIYNDLLVYIKSEKTFLDYRPFHILYEHKYSIYERMLYIQGNYCLRNSKKYLKEYGIVADAFNNIRLQVIKYNISKSDKLIGSIYSEIEQYKDIERELLTEFPNDFDVSVLNNKNNKY